MKKKRTPKTQNITGDEYVKLIGDAKAFEEAAFFLEKRIRDLGAESGSQERMGGSGWKSHNVYESLKTASHFNLGVAFELKLKCLLRLNSVKLKFGLDGHMLAKLYRDLPCKVSQDLEKIFRQITENKSIKMEALIRSNSKPSNHPPNRPLDTLFDFCKYFDKDMNIWKKRYASEAVSKRKWVHYISDLGLFLKFLEESQELSDKLAQEIGIIETSN